MSTPAQPFQPERHPTTEGGNPPDPLLARHTEPSPPPAPPTPRRRASARTQRACTAGELATAGLTAKQHLLLLDTWRRIGLPAGDFASLVGISKHTFDDWKRRFEPEGPAGLQDKRLYL